MLTKELQETFSRAWHEAKSRRHEHLTLEHLLYALLQEKTGRDVIINCGGNVEKLKSELDKFMNENMEALPSTMEPQPGAAGGEKSGLFSGLRAGLGNRGAQSGPGAPEPPAEVAPEHTAAFERVVQRAVQQAYASGQTTVDGGNVLAAMYQERRSHAVYLLESQGVSRLDVLSYISHGISKLTSQDEQPDEPMQQGEAETVLDPLGAYTIDLLERAKAEKIDPLIGREMEVQRTIEVLCRRRKNNPVYVGDPGVGKTAIAEGLALKIFRGEVPKAIKDAEVFMLDMGALIAGTKFRGQFEQRLKAVIKALQKKPGAILVIDEIHTIVGAGSVQGGYMDASNILKPALANGELRCIGSTTHPEYKGSFEKDKALARRFQKIDVSEPSVEDTIKILHGLKQYYAAHHNVFYGDDAITAAAELASKYVNDRFMPDKAIDVLDEAGASVKLREPYEGQFAEPEQAEDEENGAKAGAELGTNDGASGARTDAKSEAGVAGGARPAPVAPMRRKADATQPAEPGEFDATAEVDTDADAGAASLSRLGQSAEPPEPRRVVTVHDIEQVVARMAKIPPKTVSSSDKEKLQNLEGELKAAIYGQDHAVEQLVKAIKLSRSGLANVGKPVGSFLFSGPTGVGKTELAKQLAKVLGINLLRFDMSEYMEKHTVSRLIGAPPGYVGFDQGGLLTDAVNKTPHAVLVMDEIEKAHPDLFAILLQVMDHASLTDNNGKKADFRNVILIMTTNAGAREMAAEDVGFRIASSPNLEPTAADTRSLGTRAVSGGTEFGLGKGKSAIEREFSPEFRNRLDAWIVFNRLTQVDILRVVDKFVGEVREQLEERNVTLQVSDKARQWFGENGFDKQYGARPMARLVSQKIKEPLAEELLFGKLEHGGKVTVDEKDGEIKIECESA